VIISSSRGKKVVKVCLDSKTAGSRSPAVPATTGTPISNMRRDRRSAFFGLLLKTVTLDEII